MNVYISSENNNIFLQQRLRIVKKFLSDKDRTKKIFLFTEDLYSLKKLDLNLRKKNFKTLYIVDKVINISHFRYYLNKSRFFFKYIFFFKIISLYLKLLFYFKSLKIFFIDIKLVYIFVDKEDKKTNLTNNNNFIIFFSKPFIHTSDSKIQTLNQKKIHGNFIFYFDSAFPLHPDLVGVKKKLEFNDFNKSIVLEYLNYLDRILNSESKVAIFLAPRTFDSLNKNIQFKKFILKFNPKKYYFFKGIDSYLSFNKKGKKIYTQKGGQINFFKEKKIENIKIIKFDKKFKEIFNTLKKKELDKTNKNFLKNYRSVFLDYI